MNTTDEERNFIKSQKAVPLTLLEKELQLAQEQVLYTEDDQEAQVKRRFARFLMDWVKVIQSLGKGKGQRQDKKVTLYV